MSDLKLLICDDCLIAASNNDYTGMDLVTETRVRAGLERLAVNEHVVHVVGIDEYAPFSSCRCDCCLTQLAGRRHRAEGLVRAADPAPPAGPASRAE